MKTSADVIAAALDAALSPRPLSYTTADLATCVMAGLDMCGYAIVPIVPTVEMVAAVVTQTDDPAPDEWALAERAVGGLLGLPNVAGEQACAELIRDWRNMLEAAKATQ